MIGPGEPMVPTIHRYCAILILACVTLGLAGCRFDEQPSSPHVVLFMIDTLRADALSAYGFEEATSPELDALATDGVLFRNAFSQSSWTRPSAGSMLTGRYPRSIGIYHEQRGILDDRFTTLAEALQDRGYRTFGVTANPHLNRAFNFHQGFDIYIDSNTVYSFMDKQSDTPRYKKATVMSAAEMFDQARTFLDQNDEQAIYLQFNLMEVHEWPRSKHLTRAEFEGLYPALQYRRYYQALRQISADVGAFVDELKRRNGWDDALFVIVSDHGEGLDSHPDVKHSTKHGRLLYESQLHVPWILERNGEPYGGTVIEQPVRLLDMMPTILDLLGFDPPAGLDGRSLAPLLRERADSTELPEYFVAETRLHGGDKSAVYGPAWKYFEHRDAHEGLDTVELQVVGEHENGARSNQFAANLPTASEMAAYLQRWTEEHPPADETVGQLGISPEEIEQLRALGYLD